MTFSFKNTTRGNFRVKTRTPPSPFHGSWDPGARADTETASKDVWRWALSASSCPNTPETETQVTVNRTLTTIQRTQQSIDVYTWSTTLLGAAFWGFNGRSGASALHHNACFVFLTFQHDKTDETKLINIVQSHHYMPSYPPMSVKRSIILVPPFTSSSQ